MKQSFLTCLWSHISKGLFDHTDSIFNQSTNQSLDLYCTIPQLLMAQDNVLATVKKMRLQ